MILLGSTAPGAPREAQRGGPGSAARGLRASAGRDLCTGGRGEAGGAHSERIINESYGDVYLYLSIYLSIYIYIYTYVCVYNRPGSRIWVCMYGVDIYIYDIHICMCVL